MKIIEAKIIRYFMFIYTILGRNANLYVREEVLSYLEKVYDEKVSDLVKEVLLYDNLSIDNINLLFRKYRYMLLDGQDVKGIENIEKIVDIYNVAKESINHFKTLEIKIEDNNISVLRSFEILEEAMKKNLVCANFIYAVLNYLGIFCDKDDEKAEELFTKNAMWNDEVSILCLVNYYKEKKDNQRVYYWSEIAVGLEYLDKNDFKKKS